LLADLEQIKTSSRIFLIRHARPLVEKKGLFDAAAAQKFITDYDTASVEEFVLQHETIPFAEIKRVYCSSLPRAQLTAKAIFGEEPEYIVNSNFREFEKRIFSLPFLRLPIKVWLVTARVLWLLGFNNREIETFKQAKVRVKECATVLEQEVAKQRVAVLVAHGMLNNFIIRELRKRGWKVKINGGYGFVGVTMLEHK
jgi:broad specificity phosphatase PhoE